MSTSYPGALDSYSVKVDGVTDVLASHVNNLQDAVVAVQTAIGPEGNQMLFEARLTLTSGTPVTTSNVLDASTIYLTPFRGNRVALHNGTGWVTHVLSEISISPPATQDLPFDIFVYSNAGTPTLEVVSWTNDTTRATALTTLDGVLVKSGDTTKRYVGTGRTDNDSPAGRIYDTETERMLWNYYNRALKLLKVANTTGHTYDSATIRPFNNDGIGSAGVQLVVGVVENAIRAEVNAYLTRAGTDSAQLIGIGVNTTSAHSAPGLNVVTGSIRLNWAEILFFPVAGLNRIWITESGGNTGTDPTYNNALLFGSLWC